MEWWCAVSSRSGLGLNDSLLRTRKETSGPIEEIGASAAESCQDRNEWVPGIVQGARLERQLWNLAVATGRVVIWLQIM
jgi:hypothetical protein